MSHALVSDESALEACLRRCTIQIDDLYMCVNNFPKVVTWHCNGLELNRGPTGHQFDTLALNHQVTQYGTVIWHTFTK